MDGRITQRRRIFLLLAGFFGFVTSTAVSAVPGTAVADVVTNSAAAQSEAPSTAVEAPRPTDVPRQSAVVTECVAQSCQATQQVKASQAAVISQVTRSLPVRDRVVRAVQEPVPVRGVDPAVTPVRGPPLHTDTRVPVN